MLERDGRFFQRRSLKNRKGEPVHVHEEEITYILGSGDHARSYFHHHPNGVITKLPVTWYTQEQRWGMSPGYGRGRSSRLHPPHSPGVFFFATRPTPGSSRKGSEDEVYFPNPLPSGIGCERCHGPGERTRPLDLGGARPAEEVKKAIYHPGLDSKQAQRDLCYQCHLETNVYSVATRVIVPGRGNFSYRPGENFSDYAVRFKLRGLDDKSEQFDMVKQHGDLMEESKCFQASGGAMTCTTCHDPHVKVSHAESAGYYRSRCLSCHVSGDLGSTHKPVEIGRGLRPLPHALRRPDRRQPRYFVRGAPERKSTHPPHRLHQPQNRYPLQGRSALRPGAEYPLRTGTFELVTVRDREPVFHGGGISGCDSG